MKKFLCIFLSALLICALFIVPASAAEASLSYTIHRGKNLNLTPLDDIKALPTANLPVEYDDSSSGVNAFFFELSLPSFESLSSLVFVGNDGTFSGPIALLVYNSDSEYITTLSDSDSVAGQVTFDFSDISDIGFLVFRTSLSSGRSLDSVSFDLDYQSPSVWNGISDFIGGLFGAVGSILGGALNNTLLLMFLILIPLSGIVRDILYYNFLNKRKKSNSINRYRAKRGNYGRDSYKEV